MGVEFCTVISCEQGSGGGALSAWRFFGHVSAEILSKNLRNLFIIVRLCT